MPRSPGRRAEILDAFVRYVAERGYDRTNLGDIADELGMSKGTIVHHFGTKAQMLRELEETHLACQLDVLRMVWERLATPHERIAATIYTSALLQVIARNATVASQREVVQLSDDPAMQQVRVVRPRRFPDTGTRRGRFRRRVPRRAAARPLGAEQVGESFHGHRLGGARLPCRGNKRDRLTLLTVRIVKNLRNDGCVLSAPADR